MKARRSRLPVVVLVCLLLVAPPASAHAPADVDLTPHPPIVIVGDEGPTGFVVGDDPLTGEPVHRPGSGVVAGAGTEDDPFVIAGWDVAAVHIRNTSAHVEIRDNDIGGLPLVPVVEPASLHLEGASNVRVAGNEVAAAFVGILLDDVTDATVDGNRVTGGGRGILVSGGAGVAVTANRVEDTGYAIQAGESRALLIAGNDIDHAGVGTAAVWVAHSADVVVEGNVAGPYHTGVYAVEVEDLSVRDNDLATVMRGINVWLTEMAVVEDNVIAGPEGGGVILVETSDTLVRGNRVDGSEIAIWVAGPGSGNLVTANVATSAGSGIALTNTGAHEARGNTVTGNVTGLVFVRPDGASATDNAITGNGVGVRSTEDPAEQPVLRGNSIHGNGTGVSNDAAGAVDARENWWGCPDGPGQAGCDPVEGAVVTAPWLAEPNPLAGAAPMPGGGA